MTGNRGSSPGRRPDDRRRARLRLPRCDVARSARTPSVDHNARSAPIAGRRSAHRSAVGGDTNGLSQRLLRDAAAEHRRGCRRNARGLPLRLLSTQPHGTAETVRGAVRRGQRTLGTDFSLEVSHPNSHFDVAVFRTFESETNCRYGLERNSPSGSLERRRRLPRAGKTTGDAYARMILSRGATTAYGGSPLHGTTDAPSLL